QLLLSPAIFLCARFALGGSCCFATYSAVRLARCSLICAAVNGRFACRSSSFNIGTITSCPTVARIIAVNFTVTLNLRAIAFANHYGGYAVRAIDLMRINNATGMAHRIVRAIGTPDVVVCDVGHGAPWPIPYRTRCPAPRGDPDSI